jgi:hypothetical protein
MADALGREPAPPQAISVRHASAINRSRFTNLLLISEKVVIALRV